MAETRPDPNEIYDALRCRCCGTHWSEHKSECSRHAFRPDAAQSPVPDECPDGGVKISPDVVPMPAIATPDSPGKLARVDSVMRWIMRASSAGGSVNNGPNNRL